MNNPLIWNHAGVAKLVDALALGASGATHESSSLSARTKIYNRMFDWLHNFIPDPILFNLGFLSIRWYGLFVVLGMISALYISSYLAKKFSIQKNIIWDLAFYLIIFGLIGARIYEIFLEFPYYLQHPVQMIKIWEGGLAIHGAIIAGLITIYFFSKKQNVSFWSLAALISPGLALGQAIGRYGNWFNQELFGLPTDLPWGIPISLANRPPEFINEMFFHPTFLYESLGLLIIFAISFKILLCYNNLEKKTGMRIVSSYLILYSVLRFVLEFIKIDKTPTLSGLRWPQIMSILLMLFALIILKKSFHVKPDLSQKA